MKAKKFNQRILRAGKGSYFYIEIMILYSLFAKKNICLAVLRPKQLHKLCNRRTFTANSTQQFSVHKFLNGVPRSHSPLVIGLYFTNFEFYTIAGPFAFHPCELSRTLARGGYPATIWNTIEA